MDESTITVDVTGFNSGKIICKYNLGPVHPSIKALSSKFPGNGGHKALIH